MLETGKSIKQKEEVKESFFLLCMVWRDSKQIFNLYLYASFDFMDTYCTVGIHKVHRYSWYLYWLVSRSTSTQVGLMAHLSHFFFFHVLEWHRVPVFPIVHITYLSSFLQLLHTFRWTPTPPSWTAAAKAVFVLLQSSSYVNWRATPTRPWTMRTGSCNPMQNSPRLQHRTKSWSSSTARQKQLFCCLVLFVKRFFSILAEEKFGNFCKQMFSSTKRI